MKRRRLLAAPLALLPGLGWAAPQPRLRGVLGDGADAGFARAVAPRPFRFPQDHGAHPDFRSEWWYLTASLAGGGAVPEYGIQFTVFRQALRPEPVVGGPWDATQLYLGHLALTDVPGRRHLHAQRLTRGHPRLAGVRAEPFRVWLDGWQLAAEGPDLSGLALSAASDAFAVELALTPAKPIALQGDAGLSAKGPGQASYYYSISRLDVRGRIRLGERRVPVTGSAWLDREWSTSVLGPQLAGWDWLALHLDSGADLMLFRLRRHDGARDPFDQGLWVGADGSARVLDAKRFEMTPLRTWRDPAGAEWPVQWRVRVASPDGPLMLMVEAALDDQRMDTLITYWEGLVRVLDGGGRRSIGTGYLEMTGYA